jgi:hypothetical protein
MSEFTNKQRETLAKLRTGLEQSDPPPETIGEFAKALFGWRDIDATLAELSFDSIDSEVPTGVRSTAVGRMISFQAGKWLVDIEYDSASGHLMGRVSPDSQVTVELHSSGARFSVEGDTSGNFEFDNVITGPVSLVFHFDDGQSVKTTWVVL